jgi:hypothetical protein
LAEAADLKSAQCRFESDWGHYTCAGQRAEAVCRGFFLRYEQLFVPPGQGVRMDVTLMFYAFVSGGTVNADFATGEFSVQSPLVQLAYVTA